MDVPSGLRIRGTGGSPFEQIMMGMAQVGKGYLEEKPEADKRKLEKQKLEQEQEWKKKEFNLKKTTAAFDAYKTTRLAGGSHEEGIAAWDAIMQEADFPGSNLARTKLNMPAKKDLFDKQKESQTQEAKSIIENGMYYDPKSQEYVPIPDPQTLRAYLAEKYTNVDWEEIEPDIRNYVPKSEGQNQGGGFLDMMNRNFGGFAGLLSPMVTNTINALKQKNTEVKQQPNQTSKADEIYQRFLMKNK